MGIKIHNSDVVAIYKGQLPIIAVYGRGQKIWPIPVIIPDDPVDDILSCFYNGYWIDEYPWTDETPWTD